MLTTITKRVVIMSESEYTIIRLMQQMINAIPLDSINGNFIDESELQKLFNTDKKTISQAVDQLCEEGTLFRVHGRGLLVVRQSHAERGGVLIVKYAYPAKFQIDFQFWWDMINYIADAAERAGMFLEIRSYNNIKDLKDKIASAKRRYKLNAVVALGEIRQLTRPEDPMIIVFPDTIRENVIGVMPDYINGYIDIIGKLKKTGYQRFVWFGGPRKNLAAREREEAFVNALEYHSLPRLQKKFPYCKSWFNFEDDNTIALNDIMNDHNPDVLMTANDHLAAAAIAILDKQGVAVPQDLRVIGFDNQEIRTLNNQSISTISFDRTVMGEEILAAALFPKRHLKQTIRIPTVSLLRET